MAAPPLGRGPAAAGPHPRGPGRAHHRAAPAPASPTAAVRAAPGLPASLPGPPARRQAAAALAARFPAAYTTPLPGQTPGAWLARLRPMATAQLTAVLARAAPWQSAAVTAGMVTAEQVRDLTPGSVTIIVEIRQSVTGSGGSQTVTLGFAVTLTRQPGAGWAVYDVEPATAGNAG